MVPDIKKIVLAAESPAIEHEDDFDGDEKQDNEVRGWILRNRSVLFTKQW